MALDPKKHMPHFLHKDRLKKMVSLIRCMLLIVLSIAVLSQAIPADYSCSHTDDLDIVSCTLHLEFTDLCILVNPPINNYNIIIVLYYCCMFLKFFFAGISTQYACFLFIT